MHVFCLFVMTDNNLSLSNWLSDWRHWLNTNTPFPELFCLWAVWKRHNNYWIIWELMISSDAISLNTSVNITGRIWLHPPGLWGCLIFEVVCWRKTVKRKTSCYYRNNGQKYIVHAWVLNTFLKYIWWVDNFLLQSTFFVYTYIETIMWDIWGNCYIIMAHGLINIFIVFDQNSMWPHVLFCPSVETREKKTEA